MNANAKYTFQTLQKENYWLPPAFMALFLLIVAWVSPAQQENIARAFLGYLLPLLLGGLAAYAFLSDPSLELHFATKRSAARMIVERLGVIMGVAVVIGAFYQVGLFVLDVSLSSWGGLWQRQLIWLVPCVNFLALGAFASLLARKANGGFALVGGLWIFQLLARSLFAANPVLRYIFLFYSPMYPSNEFTSTNQVVLSILSVLFLALTHTLLKKQERYL